jgi:hypothetical protein
MRETLNMSTQHSHTLLFLLLPPLGNLTITWSSNPLLTTINLSRNLRYRRKQSYMHGSCNAACSMILPAVSAKDKGQDNADDGTASAKSGGSMPSVSNTDALKTGAG